MIDGYFYEWRYPIGYNPDQSGTSSGDTKVYRFMVLEHDGASKPGRCRDCGEWLECTGHVCTPTVFDGMSGATSFYVESR